jgi:hypothetical protein
MTVKSGTPNADDFARIEAQLFERIAARHRRQVLRHRLVAVAAVLVVAGAGVAAGSIASPNQQSNLAYCYGGSSTSSQVAQALLPSNGAFRLVAGSKPSAARIARALQLCEGSWQSGLFSKSSASGPFRVPRLQVCLRDDLIVSVFPKKNATESAKTFCESLGQSAP